MITKTRVSVVAMLAIAGLSIAYILSVGLHVNSPSARHATITVPDTNGILVGSRVLLRGIEVGHVTEISQSSRGAEITWNYDETENIPVESNFRVDNLSALGEAYVAVMPTTSGGPYLADNAYIEGENVSNAATFKDLSEQVTEVLGQTDPDKVQRVFAELDMGLPDGIEVIEDLNKVGRLLTAEFTARADELTTLLATMQPLLMRSEAIPGLMRATTPHLAGFGIGFAELESGVKDAIDWSGPMYTGITQGATPLVAALQKFLDDSGADLKIIGDNLLPATRSGAAALRTVDVGRVLDNVINATDSGAVEIRIPAGG
ncbi:ABC-type transport system involved in resistance to organic solvents, periplasmic component [Gordonia terrae C-6]|uniref:ABC-type transport system involved in resistance to organic solvents, periplasmic component n=1 Tax=Gordonia terrae C-6 TaxID=1316928 RepID=R7Y5Q1_9ACTN|nr:MlaD family protein [Gordonia terrae]EON31332.1 ABC-type transport system involved in resistance to organic solvents, periplasmic component [Gordonia terrae C-6]